MRNTIYFVVQAKTPKPFGSRLPIYLSNTKYATVMGAYTARNYTIRGPSGARNNSDTLSTP